MSAAVQEWCNAVDALINSTDNATRSNADKWLQFFQKKPEIWSVADQILRQPNLPQNCYYMAANALRSKLLYDFHELPDRSTRVSFFHSLMANVTNFAGGPQLVRTRLALCVASLAVHVAGSGEMPDVLSVLMQTYGSNNEYALVLLDIMTVVPEECANKKLGVSDSIRATAAQNFSAQTAVILRMIMAFLESTGTDRLLQKKVFKCFLSWVRHGGVPPEELSTNPLFGAVFDALAVEELFEVASDVLVELIHTSEDVQKYHPLIVWLIPRALELVPLLEKAVREGNEVVARKTSHVFIQMGESYLPIVLDGSAEALRIVDAILLCAAASKEVASNTFNFWYLLSGEIERTQKLQRGQTLPEGELARLHPDFIQVFRPYFQKMIGLLNRVMRYPDQYEHYRPDQRDDSKRFRYFAAETLLDATVVLGSRDTLNEIVVSLQQEFMEFEKNPNVWQGVEACLYCIRSIARRVEHGESNVIPAVMELMPRFTQNPYLRYTATLIIGRYSDWINQHPNTLPGLLQFVVGGLNEPMVTSSAALAFKHVCDGCSAKLATPDYVENLFQVYNQSSALPFQDQKEVIEGMSCVVCALPPENVGEAAERLIIPVATQLEQILANSDNPKACEMLSPTLTKLAEVFRSLDPTSKTNRHSSESSVIAETLVKVLSRLWPLLESIVVGFQSNDQVMEKVCRCWKYAIKTCRLHFTPLLQPLTTLLIRHFKVMPHSCFLYTVSICVDHFGMLPEMQPLLKEVLEGFSRQVLEILKAPPSFTDNPDIAEDYFEMLSRFLKRCPSLLFMHPLLPHAVQCGLNGLAVHHREACSAVMQFFGLLITEGIDNPKINLKRAKHPSQPKPPSLDHVKVLHEILGQFGQPLTNGLLLGIAGSLPIARVKFVIAVVEALLAFSHSTAHVWIGTSLAQMPPTKNPSKEEFLGALHRAQDIRAVREAFSGWAKTCRRYQIVS